MKLYKNITIVALSALTLTACSKKFLEEKRDLSGVNEEVFKDSTLATAYVDYVYGMFQPTGGTAMIWSRATDNSQFTQVTEELAGETNWNKPWGNISFSNGHALNYFGTPVASGISNNTWTRMKQINLFLDNIDEYGLPEGTRNRLKGQMLFWRAFQYFDLVRLYGGVPLVLHAQDPIASEGDVLKIPRSSTSECIEQICADLDLARDMLPGRWDAANWGRITSGAAAALKGRVLLTWASPLFNPGDNIGRWQRAYDANLAAKQLLEENGFGLFKSGNLEDGTAWENMFTTEVDNPEAVIVYGFNNIGSDQIKKWNDWENSARPKEIFGGGGLNPTKQMVDAFPMKDGKQPGQSDYVYDPKKFYKNRDPRFYKTFAYNGALWPYQQNANYRVWTYKWFAKADDAIPSVTTEQRGANSSGIYLRKATARNASNSLGDFKNSGTDFMEMRFAEVVLNLAECAIGAGKTSEGIDLVKSIRERAGVENKDGAYGLSGVSGRDAAFAAVLNERKIELAYEGKRFWDLRRWMLFNDDYHTCSRLGVEPLNGKRRTGIYIYVKNPDNSKYVGSNKKDPLYKPQYTDPDGDVLAEREPIAFPPGINNQDEYLDYLYDHYFEIIEKDDLDPSANNWQFTWYNEYYYFGLSQTILNSTPYLEQTKGWNGLNGAGTFDPLK
jgi:SusD family.